MLVKLLTSLKFYALCISNSLAFMPLLAQADTLNQINSLDAQVEKFPTTLAAPLQAVSNYAVVTKALNPLQVLWRVMFFDGVYAQSFNGQFAKHSIQQGFTIQRDDTNIKFQYRF